MNTPFLLLVTGPRGAGKTHFCQNLIRFGRSRGLKISGLISVKVIKENEAIQIQAIDVSTGKTRILAKRRHQTLTHIHTERWYFIDETLAWGNAVLQNSYPCDLLVIDEMGILEFERGLGWQLGFAAIDAGKYLIGVVTIRQECLVKAKEHWPQARVITLNRFNRSVLGFWWWLRLRFLRIRAKAQIMP